MVITEQYQLTRPPVATSEMLIRRPVNLVFEAFVDPAITSQFWFSKGSGKLVQGERVEWTWEMYNFSIPVDVKVIEPDQRIVVEWVDADAPTTVEWRFKARPDGTTFVSISHTGFTGDGDALVEQAVGSTEGFSFVLAGLKAYLEYGVRLNLVPDRFPDGIGAG